MAQISFLACVLLTSLSTVLSSKHIPYKREFHLVDNAVDLESVTFDKIISKQSVTLVMFLHFLGFGQRHEEFKKFAESTVTQPAVLAATVGVIDTDHKDNWDIAERYNIQMDKLPVFKLFVNGKENATFTGEITCDNLIDFVKKQTGVWVGRSGTLEYYNSLVEQFIKAKDDATRKKIADSADRYIDEQLTDDEAIKSASYYVRIMDQYLENGRPFLNFESARLRKLLGQHKFHPEMSCGLKKELNILQSFQSVPYHHPHDEL